jgi:hypothetical protein
MSQFKITIKRPNNYNFFGPLHGHFKKVQIRHIVTLQEESMPNGQSKEPLVIIPAPKVPENPVLWCHRFYAPVVFPVPDALDPRKMNITPRLGNFNCVKEHCTLWNAEAQECRDVTDSKSRALIAQYAFNKMNDVHIQEGGA